MLKRVSSRMIRVFRDSRYHEITLQWFSLCVISDHSNFCLNRRTSPFQALYALSASCDIGPTGMWIWRMNAVNALVWNFQTTSLSTCRCLRTQCSKYVASAWADAQNQSQQLLQLKRGCRAWLSCYLVIITLPCSEKRDRVIERDSSCVITKTWF